jgi:hypothetical protein
VDVTCVHEPVEQPIITVPVRRYAKGGDAENVEFLVRDA